MISLLVIEDEDSVRQFLKAALVRAGYQVTVVASGVEGLEQLGKYEFSGVVSDMRTPGGVSGADVHAWVKQHRPSLASRMLFITGDIVNDETAQALRGSDVPWIEKPFRVHQLLKAVEALLRG